jgi:SAM-dependent methyltransferase
MPAISPDTAADPAALWFARPAGQAILDSERPLVADVLRAPLAPLPWLWIAPLTDDMPADAVANGGRGVRLNICGEAWQGPIRCRLPLPIASESLSVVVLQHVAHVHDARSGALLAECARALVPGGRLHLLSLNPLSPYRVRWLHSGLRASDGARLRRLLRDVGLAPEPLAQGLGPQWSVRIRTDIQSGPGLRAAYLQSADKRVLPLTPIRNRKPLSLAEGMPAASIALKQPSSRSR